MRRSLKVKLSLIGAVLAAGAFADDIKANKGKADASFVEEAYVIGQAELRLSQLAVRQSSDPAVKQFAQQIVDDHTKANDALRQVAEGKGFTLPTAISGATGKTGSMGGSMMDEGTVTGERMGAGDNRMGSGSTGSTGSTGSLGSGSATGTDTTGSIGGTGSGSTGTGSTTGSTGTRSGSPGSGSDPYVGSSGPGSSGSSGSGSTGSDSMGSGSTGSDSMGSGSAGSSDTYGSRQQGSGSTGSTTGTTGSGSTGSGSVGSTGTTGITSATYSGLTSAQRAAMKKYDDLAKKTGADFDRGYMSEVIDAHKKSIRLFEKESKSGKDAELKTWATNTLPTLRHHLEMAQTIEKDVKNRRTNNM